MKILSVHLLIGPFCVSYEDGDKLYQEILSIGFPIVVDFTGTKVFASPFFISSFARFLQHYERDELQQLIRIENLTHHGEKLLDAVIDHAEKFYKDREKHAEEVLKHLDILFKQLHKQMQNEIDEILNPSPLEDPVILACLIVMVPLFLLTIGHLIYLIFTN